MSEKTGTSSLSVFGWTCSILSFILSYALHKSVLWAILHFFLGWVYLLYVVVEYNSQIWPAIKLMFGMQ